MRTDIAMPSDPTLVSRAGLAITLYDEGEPRDLVVGTTGLDTRDLTPYATQVSHTQDTATIRLAYSLAEFTGALRPAIGRPVKIALGSNVVFNGVIDSISGESESRESRARELSLTVRSRDATPWWKDVRRVAPLASVGVDLGAMARDVAGLLGLTAEEIALPDSGVILAHGNTQLADVTAWDMLVQILGTARAEPYVDAVGRLKTISRSTQRTPDIELSWAHVRSIESGVNRAPITIYRLKWLDSALERVEEQEQFLAETSATVTLFKPNVSVDVAWSSDRKKRATNIHMDIADSANNSFTVLDAGETFEVLDDFSVRVHVVIPIAEEVISGFVAWGALSFAFATPDLVPPGISITGGPVFPAGGIASGVATIAALIALSKSGTGIYRFYGNPFDYVQTINEVEAYDEDAPEWMTKVEEVQNDLIPNQGVAESIATTELLYQAKEASPSTLVIADDLRIERGDVLGLPDGRRFYVQTYARDLTRGVVPELQADGFFV